MKNFLNKKILASLLLILLFTIPMVLPLLHKGYFLSDDGEWMVVRLTAFFEALRHGQFPTRFLLRLSNEYGYPLSDFAYPGFLYIGSLIHLFKFGYLESIKILLFLCFLLPSIFTYFFLRKRFDEISSLVGSFVYLYTPYHLFDLYRRGSVGELLSISVIPFLFWQIDRGNKYFLSIGVFLLILSHNIIAFISLPFIFLYCVIENKNQLKKKWIEILTPFVLGILMSAFFWLPSIYDLRYIVFTGLKIADWRIFFADLRILGISTLIIILSSIFLFLRKKRSQEFAFFIFVSIFSVFMATFISTPVWNVIPSSFILFPFRFLSILPIGLSFLVAFSLFSLKKYRILIATVVVVICFYSSSFFISPTKYLSTDDDFYLNNFASTTANNEYTPKWVKERPLDIPSNRVEVSRGKAVIEASEFNSKKITVSEQGEGISIIKINVVYFPGWQAFVDNNPVSISYQNKTGVMEIVVPSGKHFITLEYNEIGMHLYSDILSLLGLIFLVLLFLKEKLYASRKN